MNCLFAGWFVLRRPLLDSHPLIDITREIPLVEPLPDDCFRFRPQVAPL